MSYSIRKGSYKSSDHIHTISYMMMIPDSEIKGILQISHGMCEYFERYTDFAGFMAERGFLVCGNDHLGHGDSIRSEDELGYFSEKYGWQNAVKDVFLLSRIIKKEYPDTPYILFGHSLGSFFARAYCIHYRNMIDGVILCGTNGGFPGLDNIKSAVDRIISRHGDRYRSKMINSLAVKYYNKKISHPVSDHAWISRDHTVSEKFDNDSRCNYIFTLNGYKNMIGVLEYVSDDKWYERLDRTLPVLIMSGDMDPVGNYGKGPFKVYRRLSELGCDVSLRLYAGARHELINELNKKNVYNDILSFCITVSE